MKWQTEHRVPFLCLCSVPGPGTRAALLTQNTSFSHVLPSGSTNFTAFAGSSGITLFFFPKGWNIGKILLVNWTNCKKNMVKFHPASQHTVFWCLPHSPSSITGVCISCHPPSMACSHLFSAAVQSSACGYNKDKLLLLMSRDHSSLPKVHISVKEALKKYFSDLNIWQWVSSTITIKDKQGCQAFRRRY